jgi:ecotin
MVVARVVYNYFFLKSNRMHKPILFLALIVAHSIHAQLKPSSISLDSTMSIGAMSTTGAYDITMFPSIDGLKKQAIFLPIEAMENGLRIELYAAKKSEVDHCNTHFLVGSFEKKSLEGYGYTYFVFNSNGTIISTKKACENGVIQFNHVFSTKREWADYKSKIPIVAYAPEGIKICYRIWRQDPKIAEAILYE